MNHKRKKRRQSVRCRICTPFRWLGNAKGRWPHRDEKRMEERE